MPIGGVLSEARKRAGLTQRQVAIALGIDQSVVSARENNRTDLPLDQLRRFVDTTGMPLLLRPGVVELLDQPAPRSDPWRESPAERSIRPQIELQVFGQVSAGHGITNDDDGQWLDLVEVWRRSIDGVAQVVGDSMEPLLREGDWVGVRTEEELAVGDIAVFRNGWTDQVQIKVWSGVIEETAVLRSINPRYGLVQHRLGELQILGVAVGLLRTGRLRAEW